VINLPDRNNYGNRSIRHSLTHKNALLFLFGYKSNIDD
jgi:hypothetical protein